MLDELGTSQKEALGGSLGNIDTVEGRKNGAPHLCFLVGPKALTAGFVWGGGGPKALTAGCLFSGPKALTAGCFFLAALKPSYAPKALL